MRPIPTLLSLSPLGTPDLMIPSDSPRTLEAPALQLPGSCLPDPDPWLWLGGGNSARWGEVGGREGVSLYVCVEWGLFR